MDYEKLYKEALERVRKYKEKGYIMINAALDNIFPELKESEDEKIRKDCIKYLDWEYTHCSSNDDKMKIEKCVAWLEKQGEQKPSWSEEDEYQINTILQGLDLKRELYKKEGNKVEEDRYNTQYNWLKSIRPQNKWKPSEEQLNAFEHFVRSIAESGYASPYDDNTKLLYSLLNDLKKL